MAAREPAQKRNGQRPHPRSRVRHGRARRPAQPLEHPARAASASLGGTIVTVRDVSNVARSARSGRLLGLITSDGSEKVAGKAGLYVSNVETAQLVRDVRGRLRLAI